MRCIHCGKEVRNNVIFCIHCGRPVKREYSHYACEFYDNVSIGDRIFNIFNANARTKKYKQDVSIHKKDIPRKNIINTVKQKGSSIEELYNSYTNTNSGENTTKQKTNNFETYNDQSKPNNYSEDNNQDPEYFKLKDLGKVKDNAEKVFKDFSNRSEEEKSSLMKIGGTILVFIIAMIASFCDSSVDNNDYDSYTDSDTVYEESVSYSFPENPTIQSVIDESILSCPLGSENLVIDYLGLLYDDTYQMQWNNNYLYSVEDFQPYMTEIEAIEADYENNSNYNVYEQLIYIKNMWKQLILPIYEDPDYYTDWKIDENIEQFSSELDTVCSYYLENYYL